MSAKDQIQFRYALCANSKIVDIFDLSTEDRGVYECAGCLQNVIPVLGEKAKHFLWLHMNVLQKPSSQNGETLFERHYWTWQKRPFFVEFQEPVNVFTVTAREVAPTYSIRSY